jgi:hypothetical protein
MESGKVIVTAEAAAKTIDEFQELIQKADIMRSAIDSIHWPIVFQVTWSLDHSVFLHAMAFIESYIAKLRDSCQEISCCICDGMTTASYAIKFFNSSSMFKMLFASLFEISTSFFEKVQISTLPPSYPYQGAFAFDISNFLIHTVKRNNKYLSDTPVFYHGAIYRASKNRIQAQKKMASAIKDLSSKWQRHVILYGTGTSRNPIHWCLLFVDVQEKVVIFYNSLARKEHGRIAAFKKEFGEFKFLTNQCAQQGDSKICGFFVMNMVIALSKCDQNQVEPTFLKLTASDKENNDEKMTKLLPKLVYILPNNKESLFSTAI